MPLAPFIPIIDLLLPPFATHPSPPKGKDCFFQGVIHSVQGVPRHDHPARSLSQPGIGLDNRRPSQPDDQHGVPPAANPARLSEVPVTVGLEGFVPRPRPNLGDHTHVRRHPRGSVVH